MVTQLEGPGSKLLEENLKNKIKKTKRIGIRSRKILPNIKKIFRFIAGSDNVKFSLDFFFIIWLHL